MRTQSPNGRDRSPNGRDRTIGALADRQHGVVSHAQLRKAGLSGQAIGRAVRAGRLRPVFRGIYSVGHAIMHRKGWWMAALLACDEAAALSHTSAAALWGLRNAPTLPVEIIASGDRGRKHERIRTHRMRLEPSDSVVLDGLRVTTPARTIVDLAGGLSARSLRETVERAQDLRRFDPAKIGAALARAPSRLGGGALADLLELLQPDADNARSHLERLFIALLRKASLPMPEVNAVIGGLKRDFVWPDPRLVVETDGYRYHASKQAQRRDRRRDRQLTALGWRPVRFTYEEVAFEPAEIARELITLLRR